MLVKMNVILLHFFFVILQFQNEVIAKLFFVVERFESCEKFRSAQLIYNNSKVTFVDKVISIDYDAHVSKAASPNMQASLNIIKCINKENQNSCMPFYNFKVKQMCFFMVQGGPGWASFQACVTPTFKCPLQKGIYRARNCTLDVSVFDLLPLSEAYWKVEVKISDPKTKSVIGCLDINGNIRRQY